MQDIPENTHHRFYCPNRGIASEFCVGSDCMAWQWKDDNEDNAELLEIKRSDTEGHCQW